jgi:hypothetical protein
MRCLDWRASTMKEPFVNWNRIQWMFWWELHPY